MASKTIQSTTTKDLYARWAKVYDTDGNILQSIDDLLLPTLLTRALPLLPSPISITELGAGTGRNTLKLLSLSQNHPVTNITALDLSPEMLSLAQSRLCSSPIPISFLEFDALQPGLIPKVRALEGQADLVLSTLVLEHLPLDVFFGTVRSLVKKGGVLVLSNMHAEMGRRSQAGFVEGGEKVQGASYVYEVDEVLEAARKEGFEVVGKVVERGVEEGDLEGGVVGERGRKWVGCKVWFGCVMRVL